MRRDPKIREILSHLLLSLSSRNLATLASGGAERLFVASRTTRLQRKKKKKKERLYHLLLLVSGRGAGVRCIRDKKVGRLHGFRCTYSLLDGGRGGRRGEEGWTSPLATTATKTENVVKLRNILSTLFTSGDKDRRGALSDPVLHPLEITGSDMALVSRRKKK